MTTKMLIVEKNTLSGFNDKVELLTFEEDDKVRPAIVEAMTNRSDLVYILIKYDGDLFVCRPIFDEGRFTGLYNKNPVNYHPLADQLGD